MTDPGLGVVPLAVVCEMAHGVAQDLADQAGVELLHIKGATLDPELHWQYRAFSDADVLVRPRHVDIFLTTLREHGWQVETSFANGSPFEHATTLIHPVWGYLDVHRWWPGFGLPPQEAFDLMWRQRTTRGLAAVPCAVPDVVDQALIQCLHVARSGWPDPATHPAVLACWTARGGELRELIEDRVERLQAHVAYAVLTDDLAAFRGDPDQPLWVAISERKGRVAEWAARARRERTLRGALKVAGRALRVNVEHLDTVRGRPSTRGEVAREFARRLVGGVRELRPGRRS
ncbi:nucleotidyltransferase family protein [Demetria terragena]|uniref:nucleotidyltransferase family protein n=1 Tax=Demetria terragena TaxID=63959 RepID=UPI00036494D0|nr:nucleotidyltransferase family protein [Demetria terragena]